jgi:hypothetical protein
MLVDLPQRGSDCGKTQRTFNLHATFRVYLMHLEVRSMSEAFRMYLSRPDNDLNCSGPASVRNIAPFRIRPLYLNSVPNEPAHRSPRTQHMLMTLKPSSLKSEVVWERVFPSDNKCSWENRAGQLASCPARFSQLHLASCPARFSQLHLLSDGKTRSCGQLSGSIFPAAFVV